MQVPSGSSFPKCHPALLPARRDWTLTAAPLPRMSRRRRPTVISGLTVSPCPAEALAPLWCSRYVVRLMPLAPMALPAFGRGGILRGAFGLAFRGLVCHDLALDCRRCPIQPSCPYPAVFEPSPPPGSERLSTFQDLPRPFVVDPPRNPKATFERGERVEFGLTVVGRATHHLPYFVAAIQSLADSGLGPRRARFVLEELLVRGASGERTVYRGGDTRVSVQESPIRAADILQAGDEARDAVTLRFHTPTELKDGGRVIARPGFGPLMRRLRDRASALAAFFGDAPLEMDFRGVGDLAESVRLADDRTRCIEVSRQSQKTGQRHDVGGFVGDASFQGAAIGPLMPLLRLGEVLHVGRHAAFGNGWFEIANG